MHILSVLSGMLLFLSQKKGKQDFLFDGPNSNVIHISINPDKITDIRTLSNWNLAHFPFFQNSEWEQFFRALVCYSFVIFSHFQKTLIFFFFFFFPQWFSVLGIVPSSCTSAMIFHFLIFPHLLVFQHQLHVLFLLAKFFISC